MIGSSATTGRAHFRLLPVERVDHDHLKLTFYFEAVRLACNGQVPTVTGKLIVNPTGVGGWWLGGLA